MRVRVRGCFLQEDAKRAQELYDQKGKVRGTFMEGPMDFDSGDDNDEVTNAQDLGSDSDSGTDIDSDTP